MAAHPTDAGGRCLQIWRPTGAIRWDCEALVVWRTELIIVASPQPVLEVTDIKTSKRYQEYTSGFAPEFWFMLTHLETDSEIVAERRARGPSELFIG